MMFLVNDGVGDPSMQHWLCAGETRQRGDHIKPASNRNILPLLRGKGQTAQHKFEEE